MKLRISFGGTPEKPLLGVRLRKSLDRLTKLFISLAFSMGASVINNFYRVFGEKRQAVCPVLLYHSVGADERGRFAKQMDDLLKLATPVDVMRRTHEDVKGKQVAVTFDDGFRSFRENALPELVKRNIPVILFVPSRCLGERPRFTNNYRKEGDEMVMSLEELLSLPENLVTIGSHCQTHPHLPCIDKDTAIKEIVESRKDLENMLGRQVSVFAFPYGEYNDQILEWLRQAGYRRVFSALPTGKDNFLCGRIDTSPNDWPLEFRLKVLGAYRWLPWAVALKRRLKNALRIN